MEKLIGTIPKSDNVSIIILIDDFNDRVGVNIREFVKSDKYTGFTKSGTKIFAEHFEEFKELINSIKDKDFKLDK